MRHRNHPRGAKATRPNPRLLKEWTAVVLIAFGILLAFTALLMPPPGIIHDSVLYLFAQVLIYCGSIFGIGSYIDQKMKRPDPSHKNQRQNS